LLEHKSELIEEQRRCTNIIFGPAGFDQFEAFEAIHRWDKAENELHVIVHHLAELYVLCPDLRHSFLRAFSDYANKRREARKDW